MKINPQTPLSQLHLLLQKPADLEQSFARLIRSVQQSLQVEGYPVSYQQCLASARRILNINPIKQVNEKE